MSQENKNNEHEVLKKLAPTLFKMGKVNNLRAPKGYFQNLTNSIENRIGKDIPEGYFDTLADKVLNKIEKEETKIIPINRSKIIQYLSIAASVAAILTVFFILNKAPIEKTQFLALEIQFENLTAEEFVNEMYTFESDDLLSYIDFEDENDNNIETEYNFNEINLDMTLDEMDEYLSSDYDFDVEF